MEDLVETPFPNETFGAWLRLMPFLAFLAWIGLAITFSRSAARQSTVWYTAEYQRCLDVHPGDASAAGRCAEQTLLLLKSEVHADWVWGAGLATAIIMIAWILGRSLIGTLRRIMAQRAQSA